MVKEENHAQDLEMFTAIPNMFLGISAGTPTYLRAV